MTRITKSKPLLLTLVQLGITKNAWLITLTAERPTTTKSRLKLRLLKAGETVPMIHEGAR